MATSTLFGFSIEETDGKLVITLDGSVATSVAQRLRDEIDAGRGVELLRYFAPVRGIRRLLHSSHPVRIAARTAPAPAPEDSGKVAAAPLPIDQIFNQGFEGGLDGFEKQLSEFEASLGSFEQELAAAPGAVASTKGKKA
ncbi:MAG: hypothetical protein ACTHU0_31885 [Kofleriaceae bacterium]